MTIKPLMIGKRIFPINLIQGPLAGVSCAPFRYLTWKYSQPAFSCTEMISAKTLLQPLSRRIQRYIVKDPHEGPVCFQLSANNKEELVEAARRATDYGADLIDLNCGCPVKKIRSKGAGSRLLSEPVRLYQLLAAMKASTHVPVTVKIRIQADKENFNTDVAQAVADAGVDALIVHGRHWTQDYSTPCWYEQIAFFVTALPIPVIGNGDINDLVSLKKMLATGCAGVMISRAGVGQPWLIAKLIAESKGQTYTSPTLTERMAIYLEHVRRLIELLENEVLAILQMRKLAKYYSRGMHGQSMFITEAQRCVTYAELQSVCQHAEVAM